MAAMTVIRNKSRRENRIRLRRLHFMGRHGVGGFGAVLKKWARVAAK